MATPYSTASSKKSEVRQMFNSIAGSYDFLNHFLSFGIDYSWRRKLVRELLKKHPAHVIDIATGTADLAILAVEKGVSNVTGIDLSEGMVSVGLQKVADQKLTDSIDLIVSDAEKMPFPDATFDAAMVAFGIRNFEDLDKSLSEIQRIIKNGSSVFILEFSQPTKFPFRQLYRFYSFKILPLFGRIISKDSRAYSYLPESINEFPYGKDMLIVLENNGFVNCRYIPLTFQVASIYIADKL